MTERIQPVRSPRVVVTGGAGFIGGHVVRALEARGADVVVVDKRPHPGGLTLDLTTAGAVERAIAPGTDAIVHLAAITSVLGSVRHPAETYETNVAMTAAILERARQLEISALVFTSTNAVVGNCGDSVITEDTPLRPLTPYGATKAAAEMLMSAYSGFGVRCVPLRLTNVYGPGMGAKDSIVPRLIRAARSGADFEIYGTGQQVRDYVHVSDVVAAVLVALDCEAAGPMIIGSGVSTSVLELVQLAREATGMPLSCHHAPAKVGEMRRVVVDTTRAQSFGWRPTVDLRSGLADVWSQWEVDVDLSAAAALG